MLAGPSEVLVLADDSARADVVAADILSQAEHAPAALRFVAGLDGVSAAVVGMDSLEQVEANVAVARTLTPLSDAERDDLLAAARDIYQRRKPEAWFLHT